jgi:hypothetical protein
MWEGTRTVGETRDEGDPSGASGKVSKRRYLPRFLIRNTRTHLFMSTDAFKSRRKMSCRRPQPISLTTTTQAGERCRFAAHIHPRLRQPHPPAPYLRNYDGAIGRTHRRQPRLPFLSLRVWVVSRMAAMATSERSTSQECALPLRYTAIGENLSGYVERVSDILGGVCAAEIQVGGTFADLRMVELTTPPSLEFSAAA